MSDPTENTSKSSREQLEARVVAMLLGEASPFEEEQLREQLKGDTALAKFCAEIGQTLPLLNEALDVGQAPKAKSPKPRLARKRRGKLKLLFQNDTGLAKRRIVRVDFRKTLAIAAAVCVVLFITAGLLLPNLSKAGFSAGRISINQTKGIADSEATQVAESKPSFTQNTLTATDGFSMVETGKKRPDSTLSVESFGRSLPIGGEAGQLALPTVAVVPIPLVGSLFGESAVGVLFVFNVGTLLAMWSLGVMLLHGDPRIAMRKAINVPVVTVILALVVNAIGLHAYLPALANDTIKTLGLCGIPMSILLIGAMMKDHFAECDFRSSFRVCWVSVVLRLGLLPLGMIALAKWLPCSTELRQVLLVAAAMPSAIFPLLIARLHGGSPVVATQVAIVTTLVSLGTIPLWLRAGAAFIGLDFVAE